MKSKIGKIGLFSFLLISIFFLYNSQKERIAPVSETGERGTDLLILVNPQKQIPKDYQIDLSVYKGYKIAYIMSEDLIYMHAAAKRDGVELVINNTYRSREAQEQVFNDKVVNYIAQGMSKESAREKASKSVSYPGYSEHETGLAIDFSENGNYEKNERMWKWLAANAHRFGFILRYPEQKTEITKIEFEPWHFRYVGKKHAQKIYNKKVCLEEYLHIIQKEE